MAEWQDSGVPKVKLGNQGLVVSRLGFGCTGLRVFHEASASQDDGIAIINEAFNKGITFFDTANIFEATETLLGQALKEFPREKVQVATKFGIVNATPEMNVKGTPEYVRSCCEASLDRLGLDYIDLYYQHRVDTSIPIEETVSGGRREDQVSEAIRRAHAIHPISAVQMEWSLWTREIEDEIVPLCRELGIGIVPYCPLGRGFFGGKGILDSLPENSLLASFPRFRAANLDKNKKIYTRLDDVSKKHGCTPPQLALSWLMHQGDDVVPIPGTTKIKNLDSNIGALKLKLTREELNEIAGERTLENYLPKSWKFAYTPPKR